MGRTNRQRKARKQRNWVASLENDSSLVNLKKWMKVNFWQNETLLQLAQFLGTGRGVRSKRNIQEGEILIQVPLNLLITYTTIYDSDIRKLINLEKLLIHDLLAVFLVLESHAGEKSKWLHYINSLPQDVPSLPWLCTTEEVEELPEDLQVVVKERVGEVFTSWSRVRSAFSASTCYHCKTRVSHVLTYDRYVWGYVMVNTRAVYVNSSIIQRLTKVSWHNGEANMALCPFLDMFNHSDHAKTEAYVDEVTGTYCLKSGIKYDRYEQIFISYGCHDNLKLFCEYGFYLEKNPFDVIKYEFKDVLCICALRCSCHQYKFLCNHNLNDALGISLNGLNFNMAAALYVLLNENSSWTCTIFNGVYTEEEITRMSLLVEKLLRNRFQKLASICERMLTYANDNKSVSKHFLFCIDYVQNCVNFVDYVRCFILRKNNLC